MDLLSLLPKKINRQFAIMYCFYYQGSTIEEEQLLRVTSSVHGQLTADLEELSLLFPEISFSADKGKWQQNFHTPLGFDAIASRLISETLEMRLIRLLFFENQETQTQLADELFISTSHCNRLIFKFEAFFKKQGIILLSRPMRLEGDELAIRNFYCHYFRELRPSQAISFLSTKQELAIEDFLFHFFRHNRLEENYGLRNKVFRSIFVAYIRQKNHHVLIKGNWSHHFLKDPQFLFPQPTAQLVFQLKLSRRQNLLLPDLMWLCYGNYQIIHHQHFQSAIKTDPQLQDLQMIFKDFIRKFTLTYNLSLSKTRKDHLCYHFLQDNLEMRQGVTPIVMAYHQRKSFIAKASNYYPDRSRQITNLIENFCSQHHLNSTSAFKDQLLYLIMSEVPEIFYGTEKLQILLLSNLDTSHTIKMRQILQNHFGRNGDFSTISTLFSNEEMLFDYFATFDLIITTFTVAKHYDHYPIFWMDSFITFPDLERLHQKIQELTHQKRLATKP